MALQSQEYGFQILTKERCLRNMLKKYVSVFERAAVNNKDVYKYEG